MTSSTSVKIWLWVSYGEWVLLFDQTNCPLCSLLLAFFSLILLFLSAALAQLELSKWVHINLNHKLKFLSIKMRGSKHTENDSVACFTYKTNKKKKPMKKTTRMLLKFHRSFSVFVLKAEKKVVDTVMHANRMFMKISVVSIIVNNTELLASQLRPAPVNNNNSIEMIVAQRWFNHIRLDKSLNF